MRRTAELLRNPHCCPIRLRTLSRVAVRELLVSRLDTQVGKLLVDEYYTTSGEIRCSCTR